MSSLERKGRGATIRQDIVGVYTPVRVTDKQKPTRTREREFSETLHFAIIVDAAKSAAEKNVHILGLDDLFRRSFIFTILSSFADICYCTMSWKDGNTAVLFHSFIRFGFLCVWRVSLVRE